MTYRATTIGLLGALYLGALAAIALWPQPVDSGFSTTVVDATRWLRDRGAPGWFDYNLVEFTANIALFVPLGLLATVWFRGRSPWLVVVGGAAASALIETAQWAARPDRFATPWDVVANTAGVAIGVLTARWSRR